MKGTLFSPELSKNKLRYRFFFHKRNPFVVVVSNLPDFKNPTSCKSWFFLLFLNQTTLTSLYPCYQLFFFTLETAIPLLFPMEKFNMWPKVSLSYYWLRNFKKVPTHSNCPCRRLLPPQGFKTRGGTLGFPVHMHTVTKNICWECKKCILIVGESFSIWLK